MKKILLITDNAYTYSGREKIFSNMINHYSKENEVHIASIFGGGESFYDLSSAKEAFNLKKIFFKKLFLIKLIRRMNYDYVFVISMGKLSVSMFSLNIFKKKHTKFFSCEHVSLGSLSKIKRFMKYFFLKFYDTVVVLTERDRQIYSERGICSVVIENPINHKSIRKENRSFKAIAVGRLEFQKNFLELIDIWNKFKSEDELGWVLYIAGEGSQEQMIKDKIKDYNLQDNIILLGRVKNIEDYYRMCDICLMTSIYEGLPLALLEAKSYSLPCISYDCNTGPREIISDGVDGFLVKLNDKNNFLSKIRCLSKNDELYFKMSISTELTSRRFSTEIINSKWDVLVND